MYKYKNNLRLDMTIKKQKRRPRETDLEDGQEINWSELKLMKPALVELIASVIRFVFWLVQLVGFRVRRTREEPKNRDSKRFML